MPKKRVMHIRRCKTWAWGERTSYPLCDEYMPNAKYARTNTDCTCLRCLRIAEVLKKK